MKERKFQDFNVQLKEDTFIPPFCVCGIACSSCSSTHLNHFPVHGKNWLVHLNRWTSKQKQMRRCRSTPDISGSGVKAFSETFNSDNPLRKFQRSLKLLGFVSSDFGIYCRKTPEMTWQKTQSLPRLSTKLICRTVSSNSLKEIIKKAWADDFLGLHQRKILSQAVYEEWYFKKEREWKIKQEEKKREAFRYQEKISRDYEIRKVRGEEEFQKWTLRKRRKSKQKDEKSIKTFEKSFDQSRKEREEIEKAFLRWKKDKDKKLREKGKKKKREEEKNKESERQKIERKIFAEKAFLQWKNKVCEWKKREKQKRQKKQEQFEKIQKRERNSQISFQIWKALKDEAIKQKSMEMRNATQMKRKERIDRMEARLYEAEKAFEEWLEKKLQRANQQRNTTKKNIPWIPV